MIYTLNYIKAEAEHKMKMIGDTLPELGGIEYNKLAELLQRIEEVEELIAELGI